MVNYSGAIRTTEIPPINVGWKVKGLVLCVAIAVLSWAIFIPILLISATLFNNIIMWLGL